MQHSSASFRLSRKDAREEYNGVYIYTLRLSSYSSMTPRDPVHSTELYVTLEEIYFYDDDMSVRRPPPPTISSFYNLAINTI